jgi:MFS family permease
MGDPSRRRRTFVVGLCAVCAVALLIRWPVADVPLERDEGEYAYIAQRWMLGEVPYRDAFDQKPPGSFVAYAAIQTAIGTSPAALHWGAQFYTLATLAVIALIGRWFLNEQAGLLAALFAAFMTADVCVLGNAANTEMFMILPLAGGFLCTVFAVDRGSAGWALGAGALSCLAMQCKQVALPNAVFNGLLLLMVGRPRIKTLAAYVMGGILAALPAVGYFWSVGALSEFYDCVIGHNLAYAQRTQLAEYWENFWANFGFILSKWWLIFAFAVAGLVYWGRGAPDGWRSRLMLGGWLAFSFFGVCVGGYFRDHYFFQIIPAVAVLAGLGLTLLTERLFRSGGATVAWCAAGLAIGVGMSVATWYFLPGDPIVKVGSIYGNCPFGESVAVADYIRKHTAPEETVFVLGSEPQIPYYAARKSASRYIFVYPLMTPFPDTADRQAGVLRELDGTRPRVIVVAHQGSSFFDDEQTPPLLEKSLGELLRSSYRIVGFVAGGDTRLRPYSGELTKADVPRPKVDHTLAVWRRRD